MTTGEVYLIGAGPGDPELLTLRAVKLLQQADVVLYDRLVAEPILDHAPVGAERVFVGKQPRHHPVPQESINSLLVAYASQGKRVARLKGGDPFMFGRGGEEIEHLLAHRIPFQIVPGITAANGCAAYAGIPLTHRDHAQSCLFVTAHRKDGRFDMDWPQLVRPGQTVVFYMGLSGIGQLTDQLMAHGLPDHYPMAVVEQGTTQAQRVFTGTLSSIAEQVAAAEVASPALLMLGTVVSLRDKLAWFSGDRPGERLFVHREPTLEPTPELKS